MATNYPSKRKVTDIYPPHSFIKEKGREKKQKQKQSSSPEEVTIRINRFSVQEERYYPAEKEKEEIKKEPEEIKRRSGEIQRRPEKIIASRKNKFLGNRRWLKIGGLVFLVLAVYYLGFRAFVKADVFITTKKEELPFSGAVLADRNISTIKYSTGVIPANLFIFTESAKNTFVSTGRGRDEQKAKGTITIYNNYSVSPQILVATTRFETPDHKIFRLDSRVVIPGASKVNGKLVPSSIDVKVTADKAGDDYNIPACNLPDCKFTIPGFSGSDKFKGFYAISKSPMKGGRLGSIPIVSSDDLKQAEDSIIKELMAKIEADVKNKVPKGLTVLDGAKSSINITKLNSDSSVGDKREHFVVQGEGEVGVIAIKNTDLNKYIQNRLEEKVTKGYEFYKDPQLTFQEVKPDFKKGTLKLVVTAKQLTRYHLDKDSLQQKILGKKTGELHSFFQQMPGLKKADIKIRPFWVKRIPSSPSRIIISID